LVSFKNDFKVQPYYFTKHLRVINDFFDNKNIALTYCPWTKSGICFNKTFDKITDEMLISGYLYKDNMVPLDKAQNFYWSEMLLTIIGANNISKTVKNFNLIEIIWKTVKEFFIEAKAYNNKKKRAKHHQHTVCQYFIF
jgi:hypothetical protein